MKTRSARIALLAILCTIVPRGAYAWKEQMHQEKLTHQGLDLFERVFKGKYPAEIWGKYREYIEQGSYDEDFPCRPERGLIPFFDPAVRANNHYRHAISGRGLTGSQYVGLGDTDVDTLTWAKTNPHFAPIEEFGDGGEWPGFLRWGWTAADVDNGNMGWQNAVNRYGYTEDAQKLAYYTLGFVLHLLQDMGELEHVHDDPHPASGYSGFEMWTYKNYHLCGPSIDAVQPKGFNTFDEFFINLSKLSYSSDRFKGGELSPAPPFLENGMDLARMFRINREPFVRGWVLVNYNGTPVGYVGDCTWSPTLYRLYPLGTKGHDQGEWWPTSMEMFGVEGNPANDAEGFYYIELSGDTPGTDCERMFCPDNFLPTPLLEVEDQCRGWRAENTRDLSLYYSIGKNIMPHVVAHTAGLIQYYYDIVNHPPVVEAVKVSQGERLYHRQWQDEEGTRPGFGSVKDVTERRLATGADDTFLPGAANIWLRFSKPVKDVQVKLGGTAVDGNLNRDETEWTGSLDLKPEQSVGGEIRIAIEASDKENHYEHTGASLDREPNTPARRTCTFGPREAPDQAVYSWEGYEPGADENHRIKLGRDWGELAGDWIDSDRNIWRYERRENDYVGYLIQAQKGTSTSTMSKMSFLNEQGYEDGETIFHGTRTGLVTYKGQFRLRRETDYPFAAEGSVRNEVVRIVDKWTDVTVGVFGDYCEQQGSFKSFGSYYIGTDEWKDCARLVGTGPWTYPNGLDLEASLYSFGRLRLATIWFVGSVTEKDGKARYFVFYDYPAASSGNRVDMRTRGLIPLAPILRRDAENLNLPKGHSRVFGPAHFGGCASKVMGNPMYGNTGLSDDGNLNLLGTERR